MTEKDKSSAEFFEAMYRADAQGDPWNFAGAEYELRRYAAVMRALEGRRYARGFEPGCSVGVLTEKLAGICDAVEACDFSRTAVAKAQERCARLGNVQVQCAALTGEEDWARFDLVVLCEIGYYFSQEKWAELVNGMVRAMQPGTVLLASHWLGTSKDHVQSGDKVQDAIRHPLLRRILSERHDQFRLERWVRTDEVDAE